jgi:hypothetical protein
MRNAFYIVFVAFSMVATAYATERECLNAFTKGSHHRIGYHAMGHIYSQFHGLADEETQLHDEVKARLSRETVVHSQATALGRTGAQIVTLQSGIQGVMKLERLELEAAPQVPGIRLKLSSAAAEEGAHLVDQFLRLNVVPPTVVRNTAAGLASLQLFIQGKELSLLPPREIHELVMGGAFDSIILLDYVIGNWDRHSSNLFAQGVAIDHGSAFPEAWSFSQIEFWKYVGHIRISRSVYERLLDLVDPSVASSLLPRISSQRRQAMSERISGLLEGAVVTADFVSIQLPFKPLVLGSPSVMYMAYSRDLTPAHPGDRNNSRPVPVRREPTPNPSPRYPAQTDNPYRRDTPRPAPPTNRRSPPAPPSPSYRPSSTPSYFWSTP